MGMVLVTDKKYEMDEVLKTNLDYLNKAVKVKWDAPLIVDGVEGAGKTTLTDQIYYAVGRTRALIHVYTPDGISRGKFKIYNYNEKRELYMKNKRNYSYDGIKPSYTNGNFIDTEGLFYSAKEYDDKKEEAIRSLNVNTKKEQKWKIRCLQLYELYETIGGKQDTLAEKWNVTQQYISEFKKELKNKTKKEKKKKLIKKKIKIPNT